MMIMINDRYMINDKNCLWAGYRIKGVVCQENNPWQVDASSPRRNRHDSHKGEYHKVPFKGMNPLMGFFRANLSICQSFVTDSG
jgi:hypothetical protein